MHSTLDNIYCFCLVVHHGSYIKACKNSPFSVSSLSRKVSKLEGELNMRLLERNSRNVRLTEAGKKLFDETYSVLKLANDAYLSLNSTDSHLQGNLSIDAPVFLCHQFISQWAVEFQLQHPKLNIYLNLSNDNIDLLKQDVNLSIRYGPLMDSSLVAKKLYTPDLVVLASASYIKNNPINSVAELAQAKWLKIISYPDKIIYLNQENKPIELNINAHAVSNDLQVLIDFVQKGAGIALLPKFLVTRETLDLVHVMPTLSIMPSSSFYAVFPSREHMAKQTTIFIEYLVGKFSTISS